MKHIVLIGPPGSGKGTLASELKKINYSHISTGDLLRAEIEADTELGRYAANLINKGNMVDDSVSLQIMKKAFEKATKGAIFDGYPRNIAQMQLLESDILNHKIDNLYIIYFNIPLEKLISRIINRWTCPSCSEIYNLSTKKPLSNNNQYLCINDQVELTQRKDDNEESLKTRISVFNEKTLPVVSKYQNYPHFLNVDATQEPSLILKEVLTFLS